MTKITTEQKQIMHELLDFAIECKEAGFKMSIDFDYRFNGIQILHYKGTDITEFNNTYELHNQVMKHFFIYQLTQETLTNIKNEILAIINEVPISEITDKSQNHGC